MVRNGYKKVFSNSGKLDLLLALRRAGWSQDSLTKFFGVSKSSISEKLAKRATPTPSKVYTIESIVSKVLPLERPKNTIRWRMSCGERVATGKSYKDYLMPN